MKRTKKKFDCIEFKQKAQERIYEEIKGMSGKRKLITLRNALRQGLWEFGGKR